MQFQWMESKSKVKENVSVVSVYLIFCFTFTFSILIYKRILLFILSFMEKGNLWLAFTQMFFFSFFFFLFFFFCLLKTQHDFNFEYKFLILQ